MGQEGKWGETRYAFARVDFLRGYRYRLSLMPYWSFCCAVLAWLRERFKGLYRLPCGICIRTLEGLVASGLVGDDGWSWPPRAFYDTSTFLFSHLKIEPKDARFP